MTFFIKQRERFTALVFLSYMLFGLALSCGVSASAYANCSNDTHEGTSESGGSGAERAE